MAFLENVDKAKLQKILLITISALMLAALGLLLAIVIMSIEPAGLQGTDMNFTDYVLEENDTKTGSLVLADQNHKYAVDRALLDLVDCQGYRDTQMSAEGITEKNYLPYKGMMLNKTAMENAHKLLTDLRAGVEDSKAVTIDAAFDRIVNGGAETEGYNTGLLMFLSDNASDSGNHIALGEDYKAWLDDNAAKYGFVNEFEDAYRYVGVAHAKYIADEKLSLAEYVELLKKNTSNEKGLTTKDAEGNEYYVYYVSAKAGETIKVPASNEYTVSGTNEGGVIVTVKLAK
ncbi:MAG: hypothetical protein IKJ24_00140 [Clostridia bacterium]|nr:hypothetical protein [Clostridia bacterium]